MLLESKGGQEHFWLASRRRGYVSWTVKVLEYSRRAVSSFTEDHKDVSVVAFDYYHVKGAISDQ